MSEGAQSTTDSRRPTDGEGISFVQVDARPSFCGCQLAVEDEEAAR